MTDAEMRVRVELCCQYAPTVNKHMKMNRFVVAFMYAENALNRSGKREKIVFPVTVRGYVELQWFS